MAQYLVLARKYRPQSFADLTGQEHVVQTLSNALTSGRVAHAHLFCGPRGCGKTTTARIIAKALNCVNGPTPTPCGVCTPCREITAGSDVDVQEIDAASNTGVDNVRDLRESAKYLPARDRYKIFIVDEVHMLSKAAFNAFLKTLEEPPGHVKFLFATTDPQALPDTILSRCQRHNFRLVPLKLIVERIRTIAAAENVLIDDGAVSLVARQAAGSMRDALSILDQLFSSVGEGVRITAELAAQSLGALDRNVVSELAGSLIARDAKGVLDGVARAHDGGHDLKRLADDLATHLRNLLAAGVSGAALDLPDHEIKALREQAANAEGAELARLFELVHGALFEMGRASQPRHALEIALLRGVLLAPSTSIQTLLRRADELSKRLGGDVPPSGGSAGGRGGGSGEGPRPAAPATVPSRFTAAPAEPVIAPVAVTAPVTAPSRFTPPPVEVVAAPPPLVAQRPAPSAKTATVAPKTNPWDRHQTGETTTTAAPAPAAPTVTAVAPPPAQSAPKAPERAPEPVSAPVPGIDQRWRAIVQAVAAKRAPLASALGQARLLSIDGGVVKLGLGRENIYGNSILDATPLIEACASEVLGVAARLDLVEIAADASSALSISEADDLAEKAAKKDRLREGREHPAVKLAVSMLGAEIEEVRDLVGASR